MEYQVINGKKFPPFPFYAKTKNIDWVVKVVGVCETDSDRFLAELFFDNCTILIEDAMVLSITEITFDEPAEKQYRPWTNDDVKSLLFFRDKIFRNKTTLREHIVTNIFKRESLLFSDFGSIGYSLEAMFDDLEYSTDGINWLPCGAEI
ncbi:MAG: hypothetical protein RLY43_1250 [Bacteroidota bacterium]